MHSKNVQICHPKHVFSSSRMSTNLHIDPEKQKECCFFVQIALNGILKFVCVEKLIDWHTCPKKMEAWIDAQTN